MPDNLPIDILDQVLRHLSQNDLTRFAQASRQLADIAKPLLYSNVVLEPEWRQVATFAASLKSDPSAVTLVKTLRVHIRRQRDDENPEKPPSEGQQGDLCFILSRLSPTLQQLYFGPATWNPETDFRSKWKIEAFLSSLGQHALDLVSLENLDLSAGRYPLGIFASKSVRVVGVGGGPFDLPEILDFSSFVQLKDLTFEKNCINFYNTFIEALKAPRFSEVFNPERIVLKSSIHLEMLDALLSTSKDSLKELTWTQLGMSPFPEPEQCVVRLPRLTSLERVTLGFLDMPHLYRGHNIVHWIRMLVFESPIRETSISPLTELTMAMLYGIIPVPRMRTLGPELAQLLEEVFTSGSFPNIQKITLAFQWPKPDELGNEEKADIVEMARAAAPRLSMAGPGLLRIVFEAPAEPNA